MSVPSSTTFREWMTHLISPRGAKAEWPWLLREMLTAEYLRQREPGLCYAGEVFKDRDDDDPTAAVLPEKRVVKDLYHCCRVGNDGVFRIGSEAFWLLGYEWPSQGRDRGRRADLVGLNRQGGVVVFEGKLADNSYGPFAAVLEGLDYLACLTSSANLAKIQTGFTHWTSKSTLTVPDEFRGVSPSATARHESSSWHWANTTGSTPVACGDRDGTALLPCQWDRLTCRSDSPYPISPVLLEGRWCEVQAASNLSMIRAWR